MFCFAPSAKPRLQGTSSPAPPPPVGYQIACPVVLSRQCDDTGTKQSCRSAFSSRTRSLSFSALNLSQRSSCQRAADVDAAGAEFNHCADHRPAREKFGQAVEHHPILGRARLCGFWPTMRSRPHQRTASSCNGPPSSLKQRKSLPAADASVPVDEADAFGCAEMIGDTVSSARLDHSRCEPPKFVPSGNSYCPRAWTSNSTSGPCTSQKAMHRRRPPKRTASSRRVSDADRAWRSLDCADRARHDRRNCG